MKILIFFEKGQSMKRGRDIIKMEAPVGAAPVPSSSDKAAGNSGERKGRSNFSSNKDSEGGPLTTRII